MGDEANLAVLFGVEFAKALLMAAFANARHAGLTPEQIEEVRKKEEALFLANDPSKLPVE